MNRPTRLTLVACFIATCARGATPAMNTAAALDPRAREILLSSTRFNERFWDDRCALIWSPNNAELKGPPTHSVRGTSWHALGLFMRDEPGDRARAIRAIDAVLAQQISAPGEPYDGTFARMPEEAQPPAFPRMWDDYDPNWREFIGTIWALVLIEFPDRLPAGMAARLEDSIRRAVEGELHEGRLKPTYTNIALMHGFLWAFAGERLHRPEWTKEAGAWAEKVYAGYKPHETFEEYNSPTYYGVDLYGLALWRKHGPTDRFRKLGAEMEAGLWRDIARFYHAGFKNLAGPFDRSYGMDMTRYASLTGVWLALVLDKNLTPLPDPDGPMDHAHDFGCAPTYVLLGAKVPDDVMPHLRAFQGERQLTRIITPQRSATAWIGRDVMLGGEITHVTRGAGTSQFHPATIHWRTPSGSIGWVLLKKCPRVDAEASKDTLTIAATGDSTFRIQAAGLTRDSFARELWRLPGLDVRVETDATLFAVVAAEGDTVEVQYKDATKFVLRTETKR